MKFRCFIMPNHFFLEGKAIEEQYDSGRANGLGMCKGKKILGLRFRPQHPMDLFIADFYCHPLKFGGIHKSKDQKEYDVRREAKLECCYEESGRSAEN